MPRHSAGLLPFRHEDGTLLVFVAHMGGPFWARREASWTVVKGEYDPATESAEAAAAREFTEEIGAPAPEGERLGLGQVRQSGGKVVAAFAVEAPASLAFDEAAVDTEAVEVEWPPRSGRRVSFPEVDRAAWMTTDEARSCLVAAQRAFLDRLEAVLGDPEAAPGTAAG